MAVPAYLALGLKPVAKAFRQLALIFGVGGGTKRKFNSHRSHQLVPTRKLPRFKFECPRLLGFCKGAKFEPRICRHFRFSELAELTFDNPAPAIIYPGLDFSWQTSRVPEYFPNETAFILMCIWYGSWCSTVKVNATMKICLAVLTILAIGLLFYAAHPAFADYLNPVLDKLPLVREGLPGTPSLSWLP